MQIEVNDKKAGSRLDVFLREILLNTLSEEKRHLLTRTFTQRLVEHVSVNGKAAKKGGVLKPGDTVEVDEDRVDEVLEGLAEEKNPDTAITPQEGALAIVEEDEEWLVLNKPKGLVMHPGVGNKDGTLANYVAGYLQSKNQYDPYVKRAGVVHRLDKGVSGLVIFAKNRKMQLWLKAQFENRKVVKIYRAAVEPASVPSLATLPKVASPEHPEGLEKELKELDGLGEWYLVEGSIRRDPANRVRMRFFPRSQSGKNAITYIKLLGKGELLVWIKTGRMHQIRATLKYLNSPILGDELYGGSGVEGSGISLEAVLLNLDVGEGERRTWRLVG